MAIRQYDGVGFTTEGFPGRQYDGGMHERLNGQPSDEAHGDVVEDINGRVAAITSRLPFRHVTAEELLRSDFTVYCNSYSRKARGYTPYLLVFRFAMPRNAPPDAAPAPVVERLDSRGEFRGFDVTDALMLDGDRVIDPEGNDRGDDGKVQMEEWLHMVDDFTRMRSSYVTSRGRAIWDY